jgi:hypothetical protein
MDEKTVVPENTNIILNENNDKLFAELIKSDKFISNTKIIADLAFTTVKYFCLE